MPEARANTGGISRKALILIGAVVFVLSTGISYSIFHHKGAAAPGKNPPDQTALVPEAVINPEENALPEAAPSGVASAPDVETEPSPSQALTPEPAPAAKPVAPAQTAKAPTQAETAVSQPKASPEKSSAVTKAVPEKEKEAKAAPGKTETAKIAPGKAEEPKTEPVKAETEAQLALIKAQTETQLAPAKVEAEPGAGAILTPPRTEGVAKAPAEKKPGQFKLQIGEYPDLKSMLKDMNRVKELGIETAFEEKETEGGKKDYFLVMEKEFSEGEAKAESLKMKVVHKLETTITPGPEGKSQVWIGPFTKLTQAVKTTKMLKEEGFNTRVETKKKSGEKIYLFAGPFSDKIDMIKAKAVLKQNGFSPEAPTLP